MQFPTTMKNIYLDHSATTPIDKNVLKKMLPYFKEEFGNPSSIHSTGQKAFFAIKKSRENLGLVLNCNLEEIIFTSGATESNNLAIFGLSKALNKKGIKKPHIITSTIEHSSILNCFRLLDLEKKTEVSYIPVDEKGVIKIEKLKKAIKENTVLVSLMYVNNEIGSLQPIQEIGDFIEEIKKERQEKKSTHPIYFHTDAVQAANYFSCDTKKLKVDLLSLSGHKIYGPKGIGALFVKKNTPLLPIQYGGGQEKNLRSGTLNVPGIIGISEAMLLAKNNRNKNFKKVKQLRSILIDEVQKKIPNIILNTDLENSSPSHANITFIGAEGEAILTDLDFENISISTGSACASGNLKASSVLLAMGISKENAHSSIRFTLGKNNSIKDIQSVVNALSSTVTRLRNMNPKNSNDS